MASVLQLPQELLVYLFSHLSLRDLHRCQCTCKLINDTIRGSIQLRYQMALETHGMVYNPNCTMPISDCLQALERHKNAWLHMKPVFTKTLRLADRDTGIYEFSGGAYFLGSSGGRRVSFIRLPTSPGDICEWDTLDVDSTIVDIGIALYEHDLFAAIVMDPYPNLRIKLYSLSDKKPHPLARKHSIFVSDRPVTKLSVGVEIVGDHLVLSTHELGHAIGPDPIYIFDWKMGTEIRTILSQPGTYSGLTFLSPTLLLLPNFFAHRLDVWRIDDDQKHEPVACFELPRLRRSFSLSHAACRASPNHNSFTTDPHHPFHPNPDDALIILHLHYLSITMPEILTYLAFVRRCALLPFVPEQGAPSVSIGWSQWGLGNTRWLPHIRNDLITTTSGQRFVLGQPGSRDICILDFNPFAVKLYFESGVSNNITHRSKSGPFEETFTDTMPFLLHTLSLDNGLLDESGCEVHSVIMDEERIVAVKTNKNGTERELVVWYFG